MTTDNLISALLDGDDLATRLEAIDKIEGLEADLKSAIQVAWHRGATKWVKMNYPRDAERLERAR